MFDMSSGVYSGKARLAGTPVAAAAVLVLGGEQALPWGCLHRRASSAGTNTALIWIWQRKRCPSMAASIHVSLKTVYTN